MTTRLFKIAAMALAVAVSACAASAPPMRVATAQAPGLQLPLGTAGPKLDCGYDDGGFGAPDGMKLPKNAYGNCSPQ